MHTAQRIAAVLIQSLGAYHRAGQISSHGDMVDSLRHEGDNWATWQISWFGSKSRWHQATRPTRRATREPQRAITRVQRLWGTCAPKRPPSRAQGPPRRTLVGFKKAEQTHVVNDSWFGSKSRWHQATRPTTKQDGL